MKTKLIIITLIIVICLIGAGVLATSTESGKSFLLSAFYKGECGNLTNTDYKEICFKELAISKKDASLCNEISTLIRKDSCVLSIISEGSSFESCGAISNQFLKDQCIFMNANKHKNISLCNEIISQTDMKEACLAASVKVVADLTICQGLTIKVHKLNCISNLANILGEITICDNLGDTPIDDDRNNCRARFAGSFTNPEQCEALASETAYDKSLSDNCYHSIALKSKNISLCYKMADGYQKTANCILPLAVENNDIQTCLTLGEFSSRCINQIAENTKNPEICLSVEDDSDRDNCYTGVAVESKNKEICNKVNDETLKKMCIQSAS